MASRNGEITLRDLTSWEPHLRVLSSGRSLPDEDPLDRDVDWVVTIRTGAPMVEAAYFMEKTISPSVDQNNPSYHSLSRLPNGILHDQFCEYLSRGLRSARPEASVNGYMFGKASIWPRLPRSWPITLIHRIPMISGACCYVGPN